MGIFDIIKKVFTKDKKLIICGLDYAGKSTLVSFLENGTFIEHTPTMGKEQTTIEVNGLKVNIVDMGGQKDFRSLWLGEMEDAECVIFMIDASARHRFKEAKEELIKLSPLLEKKPLIILANKYDLKDVAQISEIMDALELEKFKSFEIIPISSKTGYGIVQAFSKIYYKLSGKKLSHKVSPKALTVFDQGGIPITTQEGATTDLEILRGGLYAAISSFVKESFDRELNQLKLDGYVIILKRSPHLMGSIIIEEHNSIDITEAENRLGELLNHLENMCPELKDEKLDNNKIDYLTQQFATNLFN